MAVVVHGWILEKPPVTGRQSIRNKVRQRDVSELQK